MNLNLTILGQIITFAMFVYFCAKYIWPPLISIIEKRQKEVEHAIDSAKQAKQDFVKIKKESENYIKNAKLKAISIVNKANISKENIIKNAKEQAIKEQKRIIYQASLEIENRKNKIYSELNKSISELVISAIEKLIGNYIDKNVDKKIIEDFLKKL